MTFLANKLPVEVKEKPSSELFKAIIMLSFFFSFVLILAVLERNCIPSLGPIMKIKVNSEIDMYPDMKFNRVKVMNLEFHILDMFITVVT